MIVKLVAEDDDSNFYLMQIDDSLIENLRESFNITSDEDLMEIIKNIILREFKDIE